MFEHVNLSRRRLFGETDRTVAAVSAVAFENPDHVAIVIHSYRWRLGLEAWKPRYDELERRLSQGPKISVPTIAVASDFDGAAADGAAYASKYAGPYAHRILNGIGHNVPEEAPDVFAKAIIDVDGSAH